ncbi:MAG: MBOAT family O-acyltransferase [Oscillospiraceae bacterium]
MVWGFFKKCVCAAYLSRLADAVYNDVSYASGGAAALATAAFALQIYCDFGGYSDIARGCSEMMGVELMVNFKAPYFALSMRDFWKRWHISLTSWFREYVYFPLGGSRRGFARTLRNTLIVFALSGLWHGASWTASWCGAAPRPVPLRRADLEPAPPQRPQGTRPLLQGASVAENLCSGVYRVGIFFGRTPWPTPWPSWGLLLRDCGIP